MVAAWAKEKSYITGFGSASIKKSGSHEVGDESRAIARASERAIDRRTPPPLLRAYFEARSQLRSVADDKILDVTSICKLIACSRWVFRQLSLETSVNVEEFDKYL